MTFSPRQLDNTQTQQGVKFLGVYLDPTLSFQEHTDHLADRLTKTIYLLRNLRGLVPFSLLLQTFHGQFQSVACYAILAWGHSCHSERIFKLQRRAMRVLCGMGYREDVKEKYTELNILTIPSRFIYESLIYTYKNLNNFQRNRYYHNYITRYNNDIRPEFLRLQKSRTASNYYGIKFFNLLQNDIKQLPINQFTKNIKDLLIKKAFDSIHDFKLQ